jgi:Oxidoreductase molybdopterin binding domain/Mo-co oxidoreductase dimerisation domain
MCGQSAALGLSDAPHNKCHLGRRRSCAVAVVGRRKTGSAVPLVVRSRQRRLSGTRHRRIRQGLAARRHRDLQTSSRLRQSLPEEHGFPLRLVVPGYYATNSVKWLKRLRLADERSPGFFTTALYNDPVQPTKAEPAGGTRPVWASAPESVIVSPEPGARLGAGSIEIWGWAWAMNEVTSVAVSTDGGVSWQPADVEPRTEFSWQRFSFLWRPDRPFQTELMSCVTHRDGAVQPPSGRATRSTPSR